MQCALHCASSLSFCNAHFWVFLLRPNYLLLTINAWLLSAANSSTA